MGVTSFFRGVGGALDALGDIPRDRQRREYRELQKEIEQERIATERKAEALEALRRKHGIEDEDRLPILAGKIQKVSDDGKDSQLNRDIRFQTITVDNAGRLNRNGVQGRIEERDADYKGQGNLHSSQTTDNIRQLLARSRATRDLIGGTFRDVLGDTKGGELEMVNRFIGDGPGLMPQLTASNERQQQNFLDAALKLQREGQPQGIAKYWDQLTGAARLGLGIAALLESRKP